MPRVLHWVLTVLAALVCTAALAGNSQSPAGMGSAGRALPDGSYMLAFSDGATASMVKRLRDGAARCSQLPWIYRHDCLSQAFRDASRVNRDRPDYKDARKILSDASKQLDTLVARNVDKTKPKAKVGRKSYRPIKEENRAAVSKAGREIVQQAEIRLLRAGGIQKRQDHYQRIAEAVDATELLLRAGLLPALPRLAQISLAAWSTVS